MDQAKQNEVFHDRAQALAFEITYEKFPGIHEWDYWDTHIRDVLRWLPD